MGDKKTWRKCVKGPLDELGLHPEWAVFRDVLRLHIEQVSNHN